MVWLIGVTTRTAKRALPGDFKRQEWPAPLQNPGPRRYDILQLHEISLPEFCNALYTPAGRSSLRLWRASTLGYPQCRSPAARHHVRKLLNVLARNTVLSLGAW